MDTASIAWEHDRAGPQSAPNSGPTRPRQLDRKATAGSVGPEMELRILGPLEVVTDEEISAPRAGKERSLLAFLILHANERVGADRLIDAVWGERPPATAAAALQNQVTRLRRLLGPERIETAGSTLSAPSGSGRARRRPVRGARAARCDSRCGRARRAAALGALALARPAARRRRRAVRPVRDRTARGATPGGDRAATGRRARAGRERDTRPRAGATRARASVTGGDPGEADAGALPLRPAGGGARGLPPGARAARGRARDRAAAVAAAAAPADPASGRRARARPGGGRVGACAGRGGAGAAPARPAAGGAQERHGRAALG